MAIVFLTLCNGTMAQDYEDGRRAYIDGDYSTAFSILKPLADQGDSEAQKMLGIMYDYGHGVRPNAKKALAWYLKSARQGQPAVQYQVGAKYFRGDGAPQDYAEAARWWELAANGGQVDAQFNLGLMYFRGLEVARDDTRAADLFKRAADQGHAEAQYSLAVMYAFGRGIARDYRKARELFREAAEQGVAQAQYNLGVFYENGQGVAADPAAARQWYERAAAQGLAEAEEKLANLETPETGAGTIEHPAGPVEEATADVETSRARAEMVTGAEESPRRDAWLLAQDPDSYTLQIGSVTSEKDVMRLLEDTALGTEAGYIKVLINNEIRFNALYGIYASYDEAKTATDMLPGSVRQAKPWIRNVGILQKLVQQ